MSVGREGGGKESRNAVRYILGRKEGPKVGK